VVENHELQLPNAQAANDFMTIKFTNQQLGGEEGVALYFRAYSLARERTNRAERAFCQESGLAMSNLIQFGYWDSKQKGLVAGKQLVMDLKQRFYLP
jgi:hypothetical protein